MARYSIFTAWQVAACPLSNQHILSPVGFLLPILTSIGPKLTSVLLYHVLAQPLSPETIKGVDEGNPGRHCTHSTADRAGPHLATTGDFNGYILRPAMAAFGIKNATHALVHAHPSTTQGQPLQCTACSKERMLRCSTTHGMVKCTSRVPITTSRRGWRALSRCVWGTCTGFRWEGAAVLFPAPRKLHTPYNQLSKLYA
jgi:hypothetical protein